MKHKHKHARARRRCAPTYVDPRVRFFSRMRKTIFGIQTASRTRGEMLERRNYLRTYMWEYVCARTCTRPAFNCILRIYSGRRVYVRNARFAFSSFFSPSFTLFSFFSHFAHIPRTSVARILTWLNVDSSTPNGTYFGIYATSIFSVNRRNLNERTNERDWKCMKIRILSIQCGLNVFTQQNLHCSEVRVHCRVI